LAECCVFDKQSPGTLICNSFLLQAYSPSHTLSPPYPEVTVAFCRVP